MRDNKGSIADALKLVSRFVSAHYPNTSALLAGSTARGEATPGSDYDVVLLFDSLAEGAWREMTDFEGHNFEVFAHDLATLSYFFKKVDVPSGRPVLIPMVAEGLPTEHAFTTLVAAAKQLASNALRSGPTPLDNIALELRRYAITDLAQGLATRHDDADTLAVGTALYTALADFFLLATGHWSAAGKATPRALAAADPKIADEFTTAFSSLFKTGDAALVQALVGEVLAPHGGRMRGGFKQQADPSWRD